jgi:beta-glucanase (GH16 family)
VKRLGAWSIAIAVALIAGCAPAPATTTSFANPLPTRTDADGQWISTFADELDTGSLDTSKWFVWSGDLKHASTLNAASPSLARVDDGSLFLGAVPTPENKAFPYATGYIDTHGLFAQTYGKIEVRARAQYAPGVWYAMWGRSWSTLVPELDIELLAEDITQAWFVNHWAMQPLPPDERRGFTTVDGMDITKLHTYAIVWKPDLVEWQIDGQAYRRVTDSAKIPHDPMFWVMNAWVGGWGGTPNVATQFPAQLEIDYVRIWRLADWIVPPSIRVVDPRPKVSATGAITVELADFDIDAHVEVREGDAVIARLDKPPFVLAASALTSGRHALSFVAIDGGARTASTTLDVTVD